MSRRRGWVAAAIGLLAAALIGMHALSSPATAMMSAPQADHLQHAMGGSAGPVLAVSMGACGQHGCVSHRLASTPEPQSGPAQAWVWLPGVDATAPTGVGGTTYVARPPPRAGGGAGLGVWRQ